MKYIWGTTRIDFPFNMYTGRFDMRIPEFVVEELKLSTVLGPLLTLLKSIMSVGQRAPELRTHNVVFVPVGSKEQVNFHFSGKKIEPFCCIFVLIWSFFNFFVDLSSFLCFFYWYVILYCPSATIRIPSLIATFISLHFFQFFFSVTRSGMLTTVCVKKALKKDILLF